MLSVVSSNEISEPAVPIQPKRQDEGCLWTALFILSVIWVLLSSILSLAGMWLLENFLFEGSLGLPDVRFLLGGVYAVAILLPLGVLSVLRSPYQPFFRTWILAGLVSVLGLPARMLALTDSQTVSLITITSLLILIVLTRRKIERNQPPIAQTEYHWLIWIVLAIGGLFAIPYALWGAFGSPVDVLLGIAIAALLGLYLAVLLEFFKMRWMQSDFARRETNKVHLSLCIGLNLLILAASLPMVGIQLSLLFSLFSLVFLLAVFAQYTWASGDSVGYRAVGLLTAISAGLPLLFLDGDELMLVTASGAGELISYAARMVAVHVLVALVSGILLWLVMSKQAIWRYSMIFAVAAAMIWLGAGLIHFLAGQPGFYGERLFVILKEQVEFPLHELPKNALEKRTAVFRALTQTAEQSQADLRTELERFKIGYQPYYLVNALEVDGGPLIRLWLSRRAEVERILPSPRLRPLAEPIPTLPGEFFQLSETQLWNLDRIGAPRVWQELGIRGEGILIGASDSGVQGDHPEVASQYRGRGGNSDNNWFDPWYGSLEPVDIGGHGTHTLATVLGAQSGVAPGAEWIGCVNLARNLGNPALYLDCWQFMLAPFPQGGDSFMDGNPALGAQVLNNSWGCPEVEGCDATVFLPAVRALQAAGVFVVVSAGNSGYAGCESVDSPPAIYAEVLSVGAINRFGDLAGFSSVGPVTIDGSQRVKPEILAPGEEIISAFPGSSYMTMSGTSMAGPHLAGVVALMWSANPGLIGNIDQTRQILYETATPYSGVLPPCVDAATLPANGIGYGIVDAYAAVKKAIELK